MKTKTVRKPAKTAKAAKPAKTVRRKAEPSLRLLKMIVQALDVSQQSSITDYLVLANGTSEPHLRALRVELEKALDAEKARILGMDSGKGSGWTCVDAFEVMVHLFTPENRDKYRMETLWKDATELPLARILK